MKNFGFIIIGLFSCFSLHAVPVNVFDEFPLPDSLRKKIEAAKDEREKIDALNDACFYFSDKMPRRVMPVAQKIVYWADSLDYWSGLFDAINNLGILFYRTSQYTQAIACFNEGLKIADQLNDAGRQAAILSNLGLVYTELSEFQRAIDFHQHALKIREKRKDTLAIALSFNNLGMTYHARGEWNMALSYYQKAVRTLELTPYKLALANTYNNIGQLFFTCYHDTSTWAADSAELYFMKAYTRYTVDDNRVGVVKTLINLGNTYAVIGNAEKAIDAYRAALNQQRQMADSAGMALTLFNMGVLFDDLGDAKRSSEYLSESLKLAETHQQAELCRDIYQQLFDIARKGNDFTRATLYAASVFAINDSLNNLAKQLLIEQFQGKYNFQEVENTQLSSELKKWQRIAWIAMGMAMLIVIAFGFRVIRKKSVV
ncbi:MAG: tetratricopeptide repeat protein [Bacteroidales bacterium]